MAASPGPSTRTIARVVLTVAGLGTGLYVLYLVRNVLGLVAIAIFLSIALGPAVDLVQRPRVLRRHAPRGLAILLVYIALIGAVVGIGLLVVPPIVAQVNAFARDLPTYIKKARANPTVEKYDRRYKVTPKLQEQAEKLPAKLGDAAGALQSVTVGVFSTLVQLITVLTLTFFLLLDGQRAYGLALALFPSRGRQRVRRLAGRIYTAVSGYVAGAATLGLCAGVTTYVTLLLLGVPFAVPLALLMFFADLVPLVGATIAGVIIGVITLFDDFPTSTIVWVIVIIVYQQIENNVLQPFVYRRAVDVHPLVVIVAILVGSTLLGVLGALVAIPVAATLQLVARDVWLDDAPDPEEMIQPAQPATGGT